MKKLFLLILGVIGFVITTHAQNIKFGVKAGINFASLSGSSIDTGGNLEGSTGYHIGAVAQLGISSKFVIQPEILYSTQGIKDVDIDYINLPVLVKFKFAKFFSIDAGPQFGLAINNDLPKESDPKDFNLSAVIGVGVEFNSYFIQLRYTPGDIINQNLSTSLSGSSDPDILNENLQVSIGYYIL